MRSKNRRWWFVWICGLYFAQLVKGDITDSVTASPYIENGKECKVCRLEESIPGPVGQCVIYLTMWYLTSKIMSTLFTFANHT